MEVRWRAYALTRLLVDEATEDLPGSPAVRAACFLVSATVRKLTLSSQSESGSSIRCRLAGFGRADWRLVVVPLFSQGSVLAMTV